MSADYKNLQSFHLYILVFIFAFIGGILTSSFIVIKPLVAVFLIIIGISILAAEKVWNRNISKAPFMLALIFISFALGGFRYSVKDFHTLDSNFESQVGAEITVEGVVISEPELRDSSTRFVLKTDKERILTSADLYSKVAYGDQIRAIGKLEKPMVIEDENGKFDYAAYLSKDDIYYTLSFAEIEIISSGHGNPIKSFLLKIKRSFVSHARSIFAEPESSLLAGLIVAGKEAMPKDILEEFRRAGVVHIVVLSGYNLTIIADFLRRFFSFLSVRAASLASVIGILLFVLMTGAEATVVRASIMVLAVILAKSLGRSYSVYRALLVAAFVMIFINPKILVFDPSFQLSFLATLALVYVAPIVERYLHRLPEQYGFRGLLATTIATQAVVLPYLIYNMGEFSAVSLISNMLILMIIPVTMLLGFIAVLVSFINSMIAMPIAYLAHLFLGWILGVSHFFGNLPFASIKINSFPWWGAVCIYLAMIAFIWRWRNSLRKSASLS